MTAPTRFVVTDLAADAEMVRGAGSVSTVIHSYTATLRAYSAQIDGDGEYGEGELHLERTSNKFPWTVGDIVELPIPWQGVE